MYAGRFAVSSLSLLDVAIAMVFFFLLLSLVCSAANEIFAALLQTRARFLKRGLQRLLITDEFTGRLYGHALIQPLSDEVDPWFKWVHRRLPSYIPARTFALAMMDIMKSSAVPAPVRDALDSLAADAGNARQSIEDWYNVAMERVSGAYKRRTQYVLFLLGIIAAIAVNADSVAVIERLSTSKTLPAVISDAALRYASANPGSNPQQALESTLGTLDKLGLPIGWTGPGDANLLNLDKQSAVTSVWRLFQIHWLGWLITGLAVSFGAPFWFDVLNRFMTVRSTIKPDEKEGN
jgi:hypothetical protein